MQHLRTERVKELPDFLRRREHRRVVERLNQLTQNGGIGDPHRDGRNDLPVLGGQFRRTLLHLAELAHNERH